MLVVQDSPSVLSVMVTVHCPLLISVREAVMLSPSETVTPGTVWEEFGSNS